MELENVKDVRDLFWTLMEGSDETYGVYLSLLSDNQFRVETDEKSFVITINEA